MADLVSNSIFESSIEPDFFGQKNKTSSLSNISGLFVGFSPKSSESDSVRSPTSPLDFWVFTNLANPFVKSPKSPRIQWGGSKVGLSIIESLDDINEKQSSNSRNILTKTPVLCSSFDTQIKSSFNSQKGSSDTVFKIGKNPFEADSFENFRSCSLDSGRSRLTNFSIDSSFENFGSKTKMSPLGSFNKNQVLGDSSNLNPTTRDFIGSLSASGIELSEDYTCVKIFGPNPKTTHIFGDYVFECHHNNVTDLSDIEGLKINLKASIPDLLNHCLSMCYACKKNLEGRDIYMYRGEKAFCSPECRAHVISLEEREENVYVASPESTSGESIMFIG